jgi:hypothetical protein
MVLFSFKTYNISETELCLRLQVGPTQLGLIDRTSPYLRFVLCLCPEIGTSSVDWAQLKTDTESSLRNIVLNKNRTVDNVQKHNNCTKFTCIKVQKSENKSYVQPRKCLNFSFIIRLKT